MTNKILFLCFLAVSALIQSAQADCVRHVYNYSDGNWHLKFEMNLGEITFMDVNHPGVKSTDKTLKPGESAAIVARYASYKGTLSITDSNNTTHIFDVKDESIVSSNDNCFYIVHERGNTGNIVLNDPASGDIAAIGSPWDW